MAVTLTLVSRYRIGNKRLHTVDVAFDSSYPTGGETIAAADCGLSAIEHIPDFVANSSAGGYVGKSDASSATAPKLLLYAFDTTVGNASDVAALTAAAAGTNPPTKVEYDALLADVTAIRTALIALTGTKTGVLGQVPDTTNLLSTPVTARITVIGY